MTPQTQEFTIDANDLINAYKNQRNNLSNENAQLKAIIDTLSKRITLLEVAIKEKVNGSDSIQG